MPTSEKIVEQINAIVAYLVEVSLADDQDYAFQRANGDRSIEVTFNGAAQLSVALKNRPYEEIYRTLSLSRAYNLKMLDGALIQMMYAFSDDMLERHRLAFFPSPDLEEFQNNPDIYLEDEIYADVIARNIVSVPIRFDYDSRGEVFRELLHPKSHLTLGQYEQCRIPVTAPLTPETFIDFILRNFYHTGFDRYADGLPNRGDQFDEEIFPSERNVVHIAIPR